MPASESSYLRINNLPAYGSRIVEKNSGGIGGEIYLKESDISFFESTGNIIPGLGKNNNYKQVYELPEQNEYCFEYANIIDYLMEIKCEYSKPSLNFYANFDRTSDRWKNIDLFGWYYRVQRVLNQKRDLSFPFYVKKSSDGRCFFGSNDPDSLYNLIVTYTVIPNYTSMIIEKVYDYDGGYRYIFRLFFNVSSASIERRITSIRRESGLRTTKTTEELLIEAIKRKKGITLDEQHVEENKQMRQTKHFTNHYERDDVVAAAVKERAEGKCDLCGKTAPFLDVYGHPFLEEHHVDWLANGGEDTIENAVALCPNCHRMMHILNRECDVEKLRNRLIDYHNRYSELLDRFQEGNG